MSEAVACRAKEERPRAASMLLWQPRLDLGDEFGREDARVDYTGNTAKKKKQTKREVFDESRVLGVSKVQKQRGNKGSKELR